jgi:bifunctional UDP-N-acetylglucosamine pyrophosphorylase / glucosamine-1-phosphate N-acetyltransferase
MSRYRPLSAVVMAAGEGTRMRSDRPKPLHLLCGRPMVLHVLDALAQLPLDRAVVVVGHGAEQVVKRLHEGAPEKLAIEFVEQHAARGTGDAASVALTAFPDDDTEDGDVLVLPGDVPLVRAETLAALVTHHRNEDAAATVLTARPGDPTGYGRILRDKGDRVAMIVEQADATADEQAIGEVNTSVYCFRRGVLAPALRRLSPENAHGEYYLSDVIAVLHDAGYPVVGHQADDAMEMAGVNDRVQLAEVEAELRRRTNRRWLEEGVTMLDPDRTYIDATVRLGTDVTLFPGTLLQGQTVVGDHAEIGPDARLVDCVVGPGAVVGHTVAREAEIGAGAVVGPYAHLAPGTVVSPGARTGPFYTSSQG